MIDSFGSHWLSLQVIRTLFDDYCCTFFLDLGLDGFLKNEENLGSDIKVSFCREKLLVEKGFSKRRS